MTYLDLIYICIAFFIIGFVIVTVALQFCHFRYSVKKRKRHFMKPATFVPVLDLELTETQNSVDDASAAKDFKIQGR